MKHTIALVLLLAACGDSTGLGVDPTVDIENQTPWPASFTWKDGQGVLGTARIAGNSSQCIRFLARADSAYWEIVASDLSIPSAPLTSVYTAPWFDPTTRHAWSVRITVGSGSPTIVMRQDSTVAAC